MSSDSEDDYELNEDKQVIQDSIDLGFSEYPLHPEGLLRTYFPCKLGGKPVFKKITDLLFDIYAYKYIRETLCSLCVENTY